MKYAGRAKIICMVLSFILLTMAAFSIISVKDARQYDVDFSAIKEVKDDDGTCHLQLRGISLRRGYYNVFVGYSAQGPARVEISLDNDTYLTEELPETPSGADSRMYSFDIRTGTDRGRIDFTYPEGSQLNLAYITVSSERPLYYDGLIFGAFYLMLIPCVWVFVRLYEKSPRKLSLTVMLAVIFILMLPFVLQSGLHLGIDTRAHMMRAEGVFYGLLDGQFPVVIYPEWNNSYGQPGALYPNLFLYIPAFFRLAGMSQLGAFRLFVFILIAASAIIAYLSFRSVFPHDWQIAVALALVSLDNFRLYNMYGDGRFGGALIAEMFYPLIVAGLIDIFFREGKKWYMLSYGLAGVFCCHVVTASIVCIAVALFAVCSITRLKERKVLVNIGKSIILFAGLVLGTAVSFLKFYFSDWGQGELQWEDFVMTLWPRGTFYDDKKWIPIMILLAAALICLVIVAKKARFASVKSTYIIPSLVTSGVIFWMSTAAFPWKLLKKIPAFEYYTNMLQDSYRFVSLAACFVIVCIPLLAGLVMDLNEGKVTTLAPLFIATAVLCGINYAVVSYEFLFEWTSMLYYDEVIGEVEYQMDDYLPAGTLDEWYESDSGYISDEEAVSSIDYVRSGTEVFYSYTNTADGSYVEFPRFYYDGYAAKDENGDSVVVSKGDRNRVHIDLKTTDTPASVTVWYRVSPILMLSAAFSFVLWLGSAVLFVFREVFLDKMGGFLYNFKCSAKNGGS